MRKWGRNISGFAKDPAGTTRREAERAERQAREAAERARRAAEAEARRAREARDRARRAAEEKARKVREARDRARRAAEEKARQAKEEAARIDRQRLEAQKRAAKALAEKEAAARRTLAEKEAAARRTLAEKEAAVRKTAAEKEAAVRKTAAEKEAAARKTAEKAAGDVQKLTKAYVDAQVRAYKAAGRDISAVSKAVSKKAGKDISAEWKRLPPDVQQAVIVGTLVATGVMGPAALATLAASKATENLPLPDEVKQTIQVAAAVAAGDPVSVSQAANIVAQNMGGDAGKAARFMTAVYSGDTTKIITAVAECSGNEAAQKAAAIQKAYAEGKTKDALIIVAREVGGDAEKCVEIADAIYKKDPHAMLKVAANEAGGDAPGLTDIVIALDKGDNQELAAAAGRQIGGDAATVLPMAYALHNKDTATMRSIVASQGGDVGKANALEAAVMTAAEENRKAQEAEAAGAGPAGGDVVMEDVQAGVQADVEMEDIQGSPATRTRSHTKKAKEEAAKRAEEAAADRTGKQKEKVTTAGQAQPGMGAEPKAPGDPTVDVLVGAGKQGVLDKAGDVAEGVVAGETAEAARRRERAANRAFKRESPYPTRRETAANRKENKATRRAETAAGERTARRVGTTVRNLDYARKAKEFAEGDTEKRVEMVASEVFDKAVDVLAKTLRLGANGALAITLMLTSDEIGMDPGEAERRALREKEGDSRVKAGSVKEVQRTQAMEMQ